MSKEFTDQLNELKSGLEKSQEKAINDAVKQFEDNYKGSINEEKAKELFDKNIEALKKSQAEQTEKMQSHIDALDAKMKKGEIKKGAGYEQALVKALADQFEGIKNVSEGNAHKFEVKDMTIAGNLTGDAVSTYQPGVASVPTQKVNFSDLVPTISSATGIYVVYREAAKTGDFDYQASEGAAKPDVDYNLTEVTFNARYLAGITRYSKQMAQDLPFLQSFLPNALRRDYFKAENSKFYTDLSAAATVSTFVDEDPIERLILDIGAIEDKDFTATAAVLRPSDWAKLAITKPSDYSMPGVVTYVNGQLFINGMPVFKASWIPADKYLVGDWNEAKKIVVDGLSVQFYEQDRDNVVTNRITAKAEARVVLGIDRPDAFILGDFSPAV